LILSSSESWRKSSDYRKEYFAHNKGYFGKFWVCAYCGKVLWGKHKVQVDHVAAPSWLVAKGKKTSAAAEWLNKQRGNLVASCGPCNNKKRAKGGMYLVRGYSAKIVEQVLGTANDVVMLTLWGGRTAVEGAARATISSKSFSAHNAKKPKSVSGGLLTSLIAIIFFVIAYLIHLVFKISWKAVWGYFKLMYKIIFYPLISKKTSWKVKLLSLIVYLSMLVYLYLKLGGSINVPF
jgi:hypothetical protein